MGATLHARKEAEKLCTYCCCRHEMLVIVTLKNKTKNATSTCVSVPENISLTLTEKPMQEYSQ